MPRYLADTSAWAVAQRKRAPAELRSRFGELLVAGEIATCAPVIWELLHSAKNADEFKARRLDLQALDQAPAGEAQWQRALDVCERLAECGGSMHRALKLADAIVAASAEEAGLTVFHYDRDFELIASVTGQPCAWIAAQGSL